MTLLDKFRISWLGITAIAVWLEFAALRNSIHNDTLSERVAWVQGLPWVGPIFRCLLAAFLFWLLIHFATAYVCSRTGRVTFWWDARHLMICLVIGIGFWATVAVARWCRFLT